MGRGKRLVVRREWMSSMATVEVLVKPGGLWWSLEDDGGSELLCI